uniref:Uncharacterized protein n=1 Tax=Anguilla anguilla TaxID=7936 RepID=A0A0E9SVA7_ANGAN
MKQQDSINTLRFVKWNP